MKTNEEILDYCKQEIKSNQHNHCEFSKQMLIGQNVAYEHIINFINEKGKNEQNT